MYVGIIALGGLWSIVFKVIIQRWIVTGEVELSIAVAEVIHRWLPLDLFNPESYGIVLNSMEMYADTGKLLAGRSYIVVLPFLRLLFGDIRGFGRIIVLDVYGPSYVVENVGWAVPPIGELVANFGCLSPIIFYAVLGLVSRFFYLMRYSRMGHPVYQAFYTLLLPWLFMQQRGDFLNGTVIPGYVVLLVIFALWISCTKNKRRRLS